MSSFNQSNMNDSRLSQRSQLFSNRTLDDSMASRQSRENSFISTNRYKSPFYEGKVSFGGASAKRVRLQQVIPYNLANKPTTITRIKDSDIKRSNELNDQLSNATKNMLENIYKASSPLEDAKRIPVFASSHESTNEKFMIDINKPFRRLSSLRTPKLATNFKTTSPLDREKLQLKWEELENSSSLNTSSLQNQNSINNLIADASSHSHHHYLDNNERIGGKIRNRLTKINRTSKWQLDDYPSQPDYELPNLSLPINSNSLPTFNLNKRSTTIDFNKSNTSSNVNSLKRPLISLTQEEDSSDGYEEFKFSAPKVIKLEKISDSFYKDSIRKNINCDLPRMATTSSTLSSINQNEKQKQDKTSSSSINFTIPKIQLQQPSTNSTTTTTTTVTTDDLINSETNKTVEMYKLDKLESDFNPKENKATLANTNLPIKSTTDSKILSNSFNYDGLSEFTKNSFLPSSKKWTCDSCGVKNDNNDTKCIACNVLRLKENKDKNVNNIYSNYSFGTINLEKRGFNAFKLDSNKSQQSNSIVSTNNPTPLSNVSSAVSSVTVNETTTTTLSTAMPSANNNNNNSNKIEFGTSTTNKLINDKSSSNTNESIITTKTTTPTKVTPTAKSTTTTTTNETKPFNFITNEVAEKTATLTNSNWDTKYLPPKTNWICPSCMTSNQSTHKKCPCCEEPNPNEPKQPKDEKISTSTKISFGTSSTGGFKFNLAPSTTNTNTSSTGFNFGSSASKLTTSTTTPATTTTTSSTTGFSFANLTSSATTKPSNDNQSSSVPKFSFGQPSTSSLNTNVNNSSSTTTAAEPTTKSISFGESIKQPQPTTNLNSDNKTSSLFSLPLSSSSATPSFSFGQPAKSDTTSSINKLNSSANLVFGSAPQQNVTSSTSNLNNGELSFDLSSSTNQQQQAQSTGLFSSLTSSNNNNSNNSTTNQPNLNSSFNQFSAKTQFGNSSLSLGSTATTGNIFGVPPTTNLTNGFGSSTTTATDNNPFTNSVANQTAPALNASFSSVAAANFVPTSFNFAPTSTDQSQNSNVFQFSAPKQDSISLVGQQQQLKTMANLHGRNIKRAKRRLGSKE